MKAIDLGDLYCLGTAALLMLKPNLHEQFAGPKKKKISFWPFDAPEDIYDTSTCHHELEELILVQR